MDILVIPVLIHEVSVASNTSREAVETPPVTRESSSIYSGDNTHNT